MDPWNQRVHVRYPLPIAVKGWVHDFVLRGSAGPLESKCAGAGPLESKSKCACAISSAPGAAGPLQSKGACATLSARGSKGACAISSARGCWTTAIKGECALSSGGRSCTGRCWTTAIKGGVCDIVCTNAGPLQGACAILFTRGGGGCWTTVITSKTTLDKILTVILFRVLFSISLSFPKTPRGWVLVSYTSARCAISVRRFRQSTNKD